MKLSEMTLKQMTLRQKIGQTAIIGPSTVRNGVKKFGSYAEYLTQYPYCGIYFQDLCDESGKKITRSGDFAVIVKKMNVSLPVPVAVTIDAEFGAGTLFDDMHFIPTQMSLGAANDKELAYKRSYYWARELSASGVNWVFGPVCDLLGNFFSQGGVRCISDRSEIATELIPEIIRGIHDAGIIDTAKHFPGAGTDYRDSHYSMCRDNTPLETWNREQKKVFEAAVYAGTKSVMTAHSPFLAVDDSYTRGKTFRPSSASKKVIDILRKDMGFGGVILTDAVSMKGITTAFERDDMYIECFNAGNDIILFNHDDYIDVMEKAVKSGRVSEKRLDESVERILKLKEDLGLFVGGGIGSPLTKDETADFERCNYDIAKKSLTLLNNEGGMLPFEAGKVKDVTIIGLAPADMFYDSLEIMRAYFEERGIAATVLKTLDTKEQLKEISERSDIIVYACYLAQAQPPGFPGYSQKREMTTLFNGLSFGAEKSVVASFGATSVYYNYFETVNCFVNAYSINAETMHAFVAALFGEIPFVGKSPVRLEPNMG